jgi:1,4-dihydroxy-6-naphthoate synthase
MKLSLGFSPCPNDTFIFDALVNRKIETGDFEFDVVLEDVQTLNRWAMEEKLDISKISYGVWPLLQKNYFLLKDINQLTIAIPGEQTTANLLFTMAFPEAKRKKFMVFSQIESAVLNGAVDCGVIIHENRFTYMQKGLVKQMDLGEYWEQKTKSPIPLGGIVMRNTFSNEERAEVDRLIRDSVAFAEAYYPDLSDYVIQHAQEMQESVMRQHIDLYVNQFSLSLGEEGRHAVDVLLEVYNKMKV